MFYPEHLNFSLHLYVYGSGYTVFLWDFTHWPSLPHPDDFLLFLLGSWVHIYSINLAYEICHSLMFTRAIPWLWINFFNVFPNILICFWMLLSSFQPLLKTIQKLFSAYLPAGILFKADTLQKGAWLGVSVLLSSLGVSLRLGCPPGGLGEECVFVMCAKKLYELSWLVIPVKTASTLTYYLLNSNEKKNH